MDAPHAVEDRMVAILGEKAQAARREEMKAKLRSQG
jgi:hypothetical protein